MSLRLHERQPLKSPADTLTLSNRRSPQALSSPAVFRNRIRQSLLSAPAPAATPLPDDEPEPYEYGGLLMLGCEPTIGEMRTAKRLRTARENLRLERLVEATAVEGRPKIGSCTAMMGTLDLTDIHAIVNRRDGGLRGKPVTFSSCGIPLPGHPLPPEPPSTALVRSPSCFQTSKSSIPLGTGPAPARGTPFWSPKKKFETKFETSLVPFSRRTHLRCHSFLSRPPSPCPLVRAPPQPPAQGPHTWHLTLQGRGAADDGAPPRTHRAPGVDGVSEGRLASQIRPDYRSCLLVPQTDIASLYSRGETDVCRVVEAGRAGTMARAREEWRCGARPDAGRRTMGAPSESLTSPR